jgi:hypothetical protein
MADEQKPKGRKKPIEPEPEAGILETAAKAIGTAAGKIATLAGVAPSRAKRPKQPKLQKKNRSRVPRRQKKAQQKAAAIQG